MVKSTILCFHILILWNISSEFWVCMQVNIDLDIDIRYSMLFISTGTAKNPCPMETLLQAFVFMCYGFSQYPWISVTSIDIPRTFVQNTQCV